MSKKPLVSVILLTYRDFDNLKDTINSIFIQDYPNIELIISDDGSENYDENFINSIIKNAPNNISNISIYHHEKNMGIVKNLNFAIRNSKGEYIIRLPANDLFYEIKTISEIVNFFEENKDAMIVVSKMGVFYNEPDKIIDIWPKKEDEKYLYSSAEILYKRLVFANFIPDPATFYSRKLLEKYGYPDESYRYLNDYPYYLYLSRNGVKFYFMNKITVKYRWGGISTGNLNYLLFEDLIKTIKNEILPYVDKKSKLYKLKYWDIISLEKDYKKPNKLSKTIYFLKNDPGILFDLILQKIFRKKLNVEKYIIK